MLKKETFVEAIKLIKKQEDINRKISDALDPVCEGNGFFYDGGRFYEKALLKVLKEVMNDSEDEYSFIDWWLFEDGREFFDEEDKRIYLETPEQLYDFMVSLNKEKERKEENES